eukprot:TRINITY_DN2363_c3_g2_i2.p2 TRINITY_DN2363_c3_g2~~TRINITY_DN2363_c3_g2_i2.p2  ORF type:complete len:280 (+),score=75.47 TRINITY_DN2363_c3_g2_i2:84-923(+)
MTDLLVHAGVLQASEVGLVSKAGGGLLLYVQQNDSRIPIEVDPMATVADVRSALEEHGCGRGGRLCFQGTALTDPAAMLADIGVCPQSMLSVITGEPKKFFDVWPDVPDCPTGIVELTGEWWSILDKSGGQLGSNIGVDGDAAEETCCLTRLLLLIRLMTDKRRMREEGAEVTVGAARSVGSNAYAVGATRQFRIQAPEDLTKYAVAVELDDPLPLRAGEHIMLQIDDRQKAQFIYGHSSRAGSRCMYEGSCSKIVESGDSFSVSSTTALVFQAMVVPT